jgi:hypothetical protein
MKLQRLVPCLGVLLSLAAMIEATTFPDTTVPLPSGWAGPVFRMSQNYPPSVPADTYPWMNFNPLTDPEHYMFAVLQYCLEGNVEVDWVIQNNQSRRWYHAPWMHWGNHGREPIHGLTYERMSLPGELAPQQTGTFQNWAVGFYNAAGGYTLGQVWLNGANPNLAAATFPPNTVSVKLLFTEATPDQVPFLTGSKEWQAYTYANPQNQGPQAPRVVKTLRLLQMDVAIRDPRGNTTTGWVFGTFIFDGRVNSPNPYAKLRPVGLMWGNDPGLGPTQSQQGGKPQQTWLYQNSAGIMRHYGWLGRLNGPVDNPKSSCLSCHSTAQMPMAAPVVPPANTPEGSPTRMEWFRNILPPQTFSSGTKSLDYSLQLAFGIQNLIAWKNFCGQNPGAKVVPPCPAATGEALRSKIPLGFRVSRDPTQP